MSVQISLFSDPTGVIVPQCPSKDRKHRLSRFAAWLQETGSPWHQPNLVASPALPLRASAAQVTGTNCWPATPPPPPAPTCPRSGLAHLHCRCATARRK